MQNTLTFFFLVLMCSCTTTVTQSKQIKTISNDAKDKITDNHFEINFQMDKADDDWYSLSTTIELEKGDFVISPFSKDSVYGHFEISFADSSNIIFDDLLLEIPKSIEEYDPIIEASVNFVRQNTTYKKKLKATGKDDFEVFGMIEFVHEPRCIPYDVEFKITYNAGKMEVMKTKTIISKEYKL